MSLKRKSEKQHWIISDKLQAELAEVAKPSPPAKGLRFVKGKFNGISLKTAPTLLVQGEDTFYGHKQIIFSGFCAWVMNSENRRICKDAIALATAKRIIASENSKRFRNVAAHARFLMQLELKYQPLFKRIYYQIGGLEAVWRAASRAQDNEKRRNQARKELRYIVGLAAILDYHVRELYKDKKIYGSPDIDDAAPLSGYLGSL